MDETEDVQVNVPAEDTSAPVEAQPAPEAPVEEAPAQDSPDVAPQDVPQVHNDDGSVGRELNHVVNQ